MQWMGLVVFALQFFAPPLLRLAMEISEGNFQMGDFPMLWVACSLALAVGLGGAFVFWECCLSPEALDEVEVEENVDAGGNNNNNSEAAPDDTSAPSGSAANRVVIDDDDGDDDNDVWIQTAERAHSFLQSFSPTHLMLALGFILPLAMTAPLFSNGMQSEGLMGLLENPGVLQVTVFAIIAHSMMAIAAYRVLRDVLDGGGPGPYPGMRQGRRRRRKKLTVTEIADIVRKVPAEEFVSEKDIASGECSIARMKRMLMHRGAGEAAAQCLERADLAKELQRVRKFNEECAICAEEYAEGWVLPRAF